MQAIGRFNMATSFPINEEATFAKLPKSAGWMSSMRAEFCGMP
jgi:hypothetical protein